MRKARKPPSGPETYTIDQAVRVAGLTKHMINYLCRHEVVTPSASPTRARGRTRRYSYSDLILLRVVAKLLDQGISVLRFRKQCHLLKSRDIDVRELLARKYLVTDGMDIYLKDERILERLDSGQTAFAFVMDLEPVRRDVADGLDLRKQVG